MKPPASPAIQVQSPTPNSSSLCWPKMQALIHGITCISLLLSLAPSSYAAPAVSASLNVRTDRESPLYTSFESTSFGFDIEDQSFSSNSSADGQTAYPDVVLDKRDDPLTSLARRVGPKDDLPKWEISMKGGNFERLEKPNRWVIAYVRLEEEKPFARGGQGQVFHGSFQNYDKPTRSDEESSKVLSCPVPVVIKLSLGSSGYKGAMALDEIRQKTKSPYFVTSQIWAIEKIKELSVKDKTYRKSSLVTFEPLQKTAMEMLSQYGRDFSRPALFRAIVRGHIHSLEAGYVNVDSNLHNIMILDETNRRKDAVWKNIDTDILVPTWVEETEGSAGTSGYKPPGELSRWRLARLVLTMATFRNICESHDEGQETQTQESTGLLDGDFDVLHLAQDLYQGNHCRDERGQRYRQVCTERCSLAMGSFDDAPQPSRSLFTFARYLPGRQTKP